MKDTIKKILQEYEVIGEFDSRFFDAGMVNTIIDYLMSRQ